FYLATVLAPRGRGAFPPRGASTAAKCFSAIAKRQARRALFPLWDGFPILLSLPFERSQDHGSPPHSPRTAPRGHGRIASAERGPQSCRARAATCPDDGHGEAGQAALHTACHELAQRPA